ncbi:MAG: hypothetical protein JSV84_08540 [Gemmatimonadota bacterium]|nr:MAG: hypothetical protein JSV84_08540 [Gemmatimonadota bacterium]
MSQYEEIDVSKTKTYPIKERKNKVGLEDFAKVCQADASVGVWLSSLPRILAGEDLRAVIAAVVRAKERGKPVIFMMGSHVIKCGLSPIIIDLLERGILTAVAMNGSGAIHDFEIGMWGATSEDVSENIENGTFGMAEETGSLINEIVASAAREGLGFGEAVGKYLSDNAAPHCDVSLLASCYRLEVPVTVHVAIGTDIIHQHPKTDGAAVGETTYRDFKILTRVVSELGEGGVILNVGSAVVLPEVFLKAFNLARNVGHPVKNFTTANFDMIQHYRPRVNVVQRPTQSSGQGYALTGHHEIMIPLLAIGIKSELSKLDSET